MYIFSLNVVVEMHIVGYNTCREPRCLLESIYHLLVTQKKVLKLKTLEHSSFVLHKQCCDLY